MQVGRRIREIRLQKGLTQGDIERVSGMLRGYVSRVEHGHMTPSVGSLERFADVLDVPIHLLFLERHDLLPQTVISSTAVCPDVIPPWKEESAFQLQSLTKDMTESDRRFIIKLACRLVSAKSNPSPSP
jgi:transcriptional regulator with XRE-family HTH domain